MYKVRNPVNKAEVNICLKYREIVVIFKIYVTCIVHKI
jgi:hypothetical protein